LSFSYANVLKKVYLNGQEELYSLHTPVTVSVSNFSLVRYQTICEGFYCLPSSQFDELSLIFYYMSGNVTGVSQEIPEVKFQLHASFVWSFALPSRAKIVM